MPALRPPVPVDQRRLLRLAVLTLARTDHRRHVPPVLHLGIPGSAAAEVADDPGWEHGLRTDIVGAVLRARRDPPWAWLTRSGPLTLQDADTAWLSPILTAAAERGVDVSYVVVTRHGWLDPRSGLRHEWKRIRQR